MSSGRAALLEFTRRKGTMRAMQRTLWAQSARPNITTVSAEAKARPRVWSSSLVLALALSVGPTPGCGDDAAPADAGNDAARVDAGPDSGRDAGNDAGRDGGPSDGGLDAPLDAPDAGPPFLETYPLMAVHPEGGAYDWERRRFFMGSLVNGNVRTVDALSGEDTEFFAGEATGTWWTLGMDIDAERDRLWVCAMEDRRGSTTDDPPYDGYVWLFNLASGERISVSDLGDVDPNATCTDVAVRADGTAFITDRENGNIYRMTEGAAPTLFANDVVLEGALAGQNAAAINDELDLLFVAVYQPSRLVRVPLSGVGRIREVFLDGAFDDPSPIGSGADGMAFLPDGSLLVAFTSQVTRVVPTTGDWMNGTATTMDVTAGVTEVLSTEGGVYLMNGQAVRFALDVEPEPFTLLRFTGFAE